MASMTTNLCAAIECSSWNAFAPLMAGRCRRGSRRKIQRELQRLELVVGMIKTIEAERNAIASAKIEAEHTSTNKIQDLAKIKCIGPEFATTLVGEVFYRSFNNRKQLASYVGMTPAHFQSGAMCRDQGISKAGNAKARTV